MLDASLKNSLQSYLGKIVHDVEITASLDDSDTSQQMRTMLQEIAALSPRVSYQEADNGNARKPSFALSRSGGDKAVQFAGIPMGHEFTSLVLALLQVGGHPAKVSDEVIAQIRQLDGELIFETYISLSCQNCPEVVQALNLMAVINPKIRHTMIDGALFQDEIAERQIMAVPSIFLNGESFGQGRMELDEILAKLDTGASARTTEKNHQQRNVRYAGGGWRTCWCLSGHLCRAQRYSYRDCGRTLWRPGTGYPWYRKLYLGQSNRRSKTGGGTRRTRQGLRGRCHQPAAGRAFGTG